MKYVFGDFVLDTAARELSEREAAVRIEPKVFELLLYLLENRDRVVSKEELISSVWDGRFISEAAMSSAVRSVRKALGDDGKRQRCVKTVHGHGFRFVAPVVESGAGSERPVAVDVEEPPVQDIRFCHSADGTRLAYSTTGQGPPLVKAANWLNHLEFDFESPVWRHFFRALAADHQLIRYDARGNGLSSWDVSDFSLERQIEDLEAVVDTLGLEKFPLLGISQGCAKAAVFAARHPERVTKLVLLGGYARGWRHREQPDSVISGEARCALIRTSWAKDNNAVHQMLTTLYMPDAPAESKTWFTELQEKTASAQNAAAILMAHGDVDIRGLLGAVRAPTLVLHSRNESGVPYEQGQELAAGIKDARFVTLETANHILPATDPAWKRCMRLIHDFLKD
ncbi:MAG: alpha/beta fold hydrolase [Methyloceanibacter sp.]|nr:alpha/beta fold hydrolase [Methyloceanibacter sp.]